jgi:hypothetical protein
VFRSRDRRERLRLKGNRLQAGGYTVAVAIRNVIGEARRSQRLRSRPQARRSLIRLDRLPPVAARRRLCVFRSRDRRERLRLKGNRLQAGGYTVAVAIRNVIGKARRSQRPCSRLQARRSLIRLDRLPPVAARITRGSEAFMCVFEP